MIFDETELLADINDIIGAIYTLRLVIEVISQDSNIKHEQQAALFFLIEYISGLLDNARSNINIPEMSKEK